MTEDIEKQIAARSVPYWIPGVNGMVLDAALAELASHRGEMVLTVRKVRTDEGFTFHIDLKKKGE